MPYEQKDPSTLRENLRYEDPAKYRVDPALHPKYQAVRRIEPPKMRDLSGQGWNVNNEPWGGNPGGTPGLGDKIPRAPLLRRERPDLFPPTVSAPRG